MPVLQPSSGAGAQGRIKNVVRANHATCVPIGEAKVNRRARKSEPVLLSGQNDPAVGVGLLLGMIVKRIPAVLISDEETGLARFRQEPIPQNIQNVPSAARRAYKNIRDVF